MNDLQETDAITQTLQGDANSYRILVERYHRGLIQHLYNLTYDDQLAEDIAQEAFIQAYNKLSQYNSDYAFSTWLYKIADNLAYRQLKQKKISANIEDFQEIIPDERPTPFEQTETVFTNEAVRKAVKNLPTAYQQVVSLYYWDNFNYQEIADIIDHPVGTVRTWLFRAKELLRKELYGQI